MTDVDLGTVRVSIGWSPAAMSGEQDLDLSAFEVGQTGAVLDDDHFVFFNNMVSPDGAVRLANFSGLQERSPRERLTIRLGGVDERVHRIALVVSSYNSLMSFGDVSDGYLQVESETAGALAWYDLTQVPSGYAFEWGELYRDGERWLLQATGIAYPTLEDACAAHGV